MPRKAKPLRMWGLIDPSNQLCGIIEPSRKGVIQYMVDWDGGYPCGYNPADWKSFRKEGYRAVRVTVREE